MKSRRKMTFRLRLALFGKDLFGLEVELEPP